MCRTEILETWEVREKTFKELINGLLPLWRGTLGEVLRPFSSN